MSNEDMINAILPVIQDNNKILLLLQQFIINNLLTMDTDALQKIMVILNIPQN